MKRLVLVFGVGIAAISLFSQKHGSKVLKKQVVEAEFEAIAQDQYQGLFEEDRFNAFKKQFQLMQESFASFSDEVLPGMFSSYEHFLNHAPDKKNTVVAYIKAFYLIQQKMMAGEPVPLMLKNRLYGLRSLLH